MTVDAGFARWLREGVLYAASNDAGIAAAWGPLARSADITSCLATEAGANDEGARQLAFLKGPLAVDEHLVAGSRFDLLGRLVRLTGDRLGYEAGVLSFVIAVEEMEDTSLTKLTVLRRLA